MTRHPDIHRHSDGSIDIDHYRARAAEERVKALRRTHKSLDETGAAVFRRATELLSRRPGFRVRVPAAAGR
jgi:hypothetical protein